MFFFRDIMIFIKNRRDVVFCTGGYASVMLPYRKIHRSGRRNIPYGSAEKPLWGHRTVCFAARNGVSCAVTVACPRRERCFPAPEKAVPHGFIWHI